VISEDTVVWGLPECMSSDVIFFLKDLGEGLYQLCFSQKEVDVP